MQLHVEVRDSPNGVFGSWARWTRASPDAQSCWDVAVAAVAAAVPPAGARRLAPPDPLARNCLLDGWFLDWFD